MCYYKFYYYYLLEFVTIYIYLTNKNQCIKMFCNESRCVYVRLTLCVAAYCVFANIHRCLLCNCL